jgi:hypothetical protein
MSVHYCEATGQTLTRHYRDETTPSGVPTPTIYPTKDDAGNPLSTEFGLSIFRFENISHFILFVFIHVFLVIYHHHMSPHCYRWLFLQNIL